MNMLHQTRKFINYVRLTLFVPVFIFATVLFLHSDSAITQDLGRHLILGKIIWEDKYIPETNFFSYTFPNYPFINHHWGSEVIFYLINRHFSVNGLILSKSVILITALLILSIFTIKKSNALALLLSLIFALEIIRDRTEIRPEIFSLFFFSIFLTILYREKVKSSLLIWLLPLVEIFWVNLHISFIIGLAVYILFLFDRFIFRMCKTKYLFIGVILLASVFLNPFGWRGVVYPLQILSNYGMPVVENQSVFYLEKIVDNPSIMYFKIAFFLFICISPILLVSKKLFEVAIGFFVGIMAFTAVRHLPFFALSLILPMSLGLSIMGDKFARFVKITQKTCRGIITLASVFLVGFVIYETQMIVNNKYYQAHSLPVRFGFGSVAGASRLVDFYLSNKFSGPIFNNFDIGSYLIFRLFPGEKVFVDGRPEAYPADFFKNEYIPMQEKEDIWRELEKKYKFKTIIFVHTDASPWGQAFLGRIIKDPYWAVVYFDDVGLILRRKDLLSSTIESIDTIDRFKRYSLKRIKEADQSDELIRLAHFFLLIERRDLEDLALVKARSIISL